MLDVQLASTCSQMVLIIKSRTDSFGFETNRSDFMNHLEWFIEDLTQKNDSF